MASRDYHSLDRSDAVRPAADAAPLPDRNLMESVLRATLSASSPTEPLDPAEREAIREVVRRYHGWPLVLDPVADQLVQAMLRGSLPASWTASEAWRRMTAQIAATLCDDPHSRARLEHLWARLGEELA